MRYMLFRFLQKQVNKWLHLSLLHSKTQSKTFQNLNFLIRNLSISPCY